MSPDEWDSARPAQPPAQAGDDVDFKAGRRKKATLVDPTKTDRLPPHSVEAEQGVLGCIMLEPQECLAVCTERLGGSEEVFYDLRHQTIYRTLIDMYQAQEPIDTITVQSKLRGRQQLEGVGGIVYLASLPDAVPSAANVDYYIEIVKEKHLLRRLVGTCTDIVSRAYEHQGSIDTLIDTVDRDMSAICRRDNTSHRVTTAQAGETFANDLERRWLTEGPTGILTDLAEFDRYNEGLQAGEMFVLGARPSQGKTALGLHVLHRACIVDRIKTDFITLEMPAHSLHRRLAARCCRIPMGNLVHGNIGLEEFDRLAQFNASLRDAPLTFHDYSSSPASDQLVVSIIRRAAADGTRLVIIDYLQYISSSKKNKNDQKRIEVGSVSTALKRVAKETGVALLVLAQLNRESVKGDAKNKSPRPPRVSDLAESSQIEMDADVIGLVYREESAPSIVNLLIRKNRDGMSGYNVTLNFNMQYQEFTAYAHPGMA